MPQTDPTIARVELLGRPIIFAAHLDLEPGEVNPDMLIATHGLLIGALEGDVEAAEAAANWDSLQIGMNHNDLGTKVIASVRVL